MRKIIVTGFSGFVARHYLDYLKEQKEKDISILGLDIVNPLYDIEEYKESMNVEFIALNLMDEKRVKKIIVDFQPTEILHLAAFSSVSYSWENPADCFSNNTKVFLSVVESVRTLGLKTRILSVGSSEIYGNVTEDMIPLAEDMVVHPLSPYAIARQAQEELSKVFVQKFGMDIVLTRSFNHIGPRQDARFVVPSVIARILEARKRITTTNDLTVTIETGNVNIVRDFLDVRDVVRAYDLLLKYGEKGEVYNIAGNHGVAIAELINQIGELVGINVKTETNPIYVRPDDNFRVIGSYKKIKQATGWEPEISLRQTIEDMIKYMS